MHGVCGIQEWDCGSMAFRGLAIRSRRWRGSAVCYSHLGGVEGCVEKSEETDREHVLVMLKIVEHSWKFWTGTRTIMYSCWHRASTDQMVFPTRNPERCGSMTFQPP